MVSLAFTPTPVLVMSRLRRPLLLAGPWNRFSTPPASRASLISTARKERGSCEAECVRRERARTERWRQRERSECELRVGPRSTSARQRHAHRSLRARPAPSHAKANEAPQIGNGAPQDCRGPPGRILEDCWTSLSRSSGRAVSRTALISLYNLNLGYIVCING
jgi:hypothetical protein